MPGSVRNCAMALGTAIIASFVACASCQPSAAQQAADPRLAMPIRLAERSATMQGMLRKVVASTGINVVADGTPLVTQASFDFEGPAREALDRIGALFDYGWRQYAAGTVIMEKRFQNAEDRPQLHAGELRKAVKDILAALPPAPPDPDMQMWPVLLRNLGAGLDPAQAQGLRAGAVLPYTSLSPPQRQAVSAAINVRAFGVVRGIWQRVEFHLDHLDESAVAAEALGAPGVRDGQRVQPESVAFVTRQGKTVQDATGLGEIVVPVDHGRGAEPSPEQRSRTVVAQAATTTEARAQPGAAPGSLDARVDLDLGEVTLQAAAAELSRRTGVVVAPADHLRDRRLLVMMPHASWRRAIGAITDMGGWVWKEDDKGGYIIASPAVRRAAGRRKITAALQSALPRDLRTYLRLPDPASKDPMVPAALLFASTIDRAVERSRARLVEAMKPRLERDKEVPYGDLSEQEREDLFLVLLFSRYREISQLLYGDFGLHDMDPAESSLHLENGEILMLDTGVNGPPDHHIGFGVNVRDVLR